MLDVARLRAHAEGPDDRGDDRHAADHERIERDPGGLVEGEDAEQDHGDRGHRIGLEQVGRHAGAVAHVVAHVVGDRRRVAGVVLGDSRLHLADEISPHVGGLGEDAASQSREDRDQRATEAEPDEGVDRRLGAVVEEGRQRPVVARDTDQRETDDQQTRDRPTAEGDPQRRGDAAARGLRDAGVRADRDVHPDVSGRARQEAADRKPAGHRDVLDEDERDKQHDADDRDRGVLAVQVGACALLNGQRDALHPLVARREREQ